MRKKAGTEAKKKLAIRRLARGEAAVAVAKNLGLAAGTVRQWSKRLSTLVEAADMQHPPFWRLLEVAGSPPPTTLRPSALHHAPSEEVWVFGGDRPRAEIDADYQESDRPVEQRNLLFRLTMDAQERLSWHGPIASADTYPNPANLPSGALPRSESAWVPTANPRYLMLQGGDSMARGVTYLDQGGMADWVAFDLRSQQWIQLRHPRESRSSLPVMKRHAAILDPVTRRVIMLLAFEMEVEIPEYDPALGLPGLVFDTEGEPGEWTHRRLATTGSAPSFRADYSFTRVGRRAVVFGGVHEVHRRGRWQVEHPDDVSVLDLDTLHWTTLEPRGDRPMGRMGHGAVAVDDRRLLVIGGERGYGKKAVRLFDVHLLDLQQGTWRKVTTLPDLPRGASFIGLGPPGRVYVLALGGLARGFPVFRLSPS